MPWRAGWSRASELGARRWFAAVQPGLLVPVVLAVAVLGGLPLLLITTLALVAVYSRDPARRAAAEEVLDRLLSALRPREPSTPLGGIGGRASPERDDPQ